MLNVAGQTEINPYTQAGIDQKIKMAQMLQQNAMQPQNIAPQQSLLTTLAPIIAALIGKKQAAGAKREGKELFQQQQAGRNDALANAMQAYKGIPAMPATPQQEGPARTPEEQNALQAVPAAPAVPGGNMAMAESLIQSGIPDYQKQGMGMLAPTQGQDPATIKEFKYLQAKFPEKKWTYPEYLEMKRANQIATIGGVPTQIMQGGGGAREMSTLEKETGAKRELAASAKEGGELGAARTELADFEANIPRLEEVVGQLSTLGKTATYTKAGQARDATQRQLGMKMGEGAIARREYIAKIDNEILPLLRLTFGAAFTEREGQSLKATLGDVNASPEEKDAVLKSFIDSKRAQIETKRRRVSGKSDAKTGQVIPGGAQSIDSLVDKYAD